MFDTFKGRKSRNPQFGPLAPDVERFKQRTPEPLIDVKHVDNPAIVTIFGGGIAGLTAAHELVTRGCLVQVVEGRRDAYARGRPQVGGMAATQFARVRANIEDLHPELLEPWLGESDKTRQWLLQMFAYNRSWWIQTEKPEEIHGALYAPPHARADEGPTIGDVMMKMLVAARQRYRRRWLWDLLVRAAIIGQVEGLRGANALDTAKGVFDDAIELGTLGVVREICALVERWPGGLSVREPEFWSNPDAIEAAVEREFLCFRLVPNALQGVVGAEDVARKLLGQWQEFFSTREFVDERNARISLKYNLRRPPRRFLNNLVQPVQVQMADALTWGDDHPVAWLEVEIIEQRLPGEHGFRFFPGYYRHIDDTMKRIPLCPGPCGSRTVYDNLRPTTRQAIGLSEDDRLQAFGDRAAALAKDPPSPADLVIEIKRDAPTTLEGLRDRTDRFVRRLGAEPEDAALFGARLLRFATSSPERRRKHYEQIGWGDFVGLPPTQDQPARAGALPVLPYSQAMQYQIRASAQCLLALSAAEADARSYGDTAWQLLMDSATDGSTTDRTLNGPTSDAWLEPWREHLERLGVRFFLGTLSGIVPAANGELIPQFAGWNKMRRVSQDGHVLLTHHAASPGRRPDFYVLALDLDTTATLTAGYAEDSEALDFKSLQRFRSAIDAGDGLKDLTGIQFFFEAKTSIGKGHMYFPHSKWGLSSISQSEFWSERGGFADGYIGVLSVDIAKPAAEADVQQRVESEEGEEQPRVARQSSPPMTFNAALREEGGAFKVARRAWGQLEGRIGNVDELPRPRAFHVDQNIDLEHGPIKNTTPYLAALPGTWHLRPGLKDDGGIEYRLNHKRWVMCGTFMATHTRMTTMEAANESGRHAAKAILEKLQEKDSASDYFAERGGARFAIHTGENNAYNHASDLRRFDPPDIWNIEEYELEDLKFFRELDAELLALGLPHWMDICDFDARLVLMLQSAKLDREAGLKRIDMSEQLLASTIKSVDTILGTKLVRQDFRDATGRINTLVRKFLEIR